MNSKILVTITLLVTISLALEDNDPRICVVPEYLEKHCNRDCRKGPCKCKLQYSSRPTYPDTQNPSYPTMPKPTPILDVENNF
uniref:Secreted protein n=1 Tax=Parastrongyloides trichosuri TaxID=131310 RepID=A0A0N4ZKW7_PARTI